jgi:transcriptional regulator with XRE-family HTH domain
MTNTDDIALELGKVIRTRRKQLRLTQQDVADLTGLARYTIGRVEKGDPGTQLDTLGRVADAVGLVVSLSTQYRDS